MRLQIDTKEKTIKVDENVKFDELIKVLNKLLPKEWKTYTLESNCTIYWGTYPTYPWRWNEPWRIGDVTYGAAGTGTSSVTKYNAEVPSTLTMNMVYNVEVLN